ncbi:unnamed protein product [Blepharisma stoltei]|uniref:Uncharacterized protein n=1 Tax=Blepharisma stoltei TaxID=1481888 RepID=A0AAU9J714_9CILI|nr:unnamed protein product [Blepharisma stoltei]
MTYQWTSITRICLSLYQDSTTMKNIEIDENSITTSDFRVILKKLRVENRLVKFMIKEIKDLFKSNFLHRRYMVVLLHFLISEMPFIDKDSLIALLKESNEEIVNIVHNSIIDLSYLSEHQIFMSLVSQTDILIKEALIGIEDLGALQTNYIRKIKQYD